MRLRPFLEVNQMQIGHIELFVTNNVAQAARRLSQRGLAFQGNDGSNECLTFTDPDGHWFQLVNPEVH